MISQRFSLQVLFIALTLVASFMAAIVAGQLVGMAVWLAAATGLFIVVAPGEVPWTKRGLALLMGAGAGVLGFCLLHEHLGGGTIGSGWYRGSGDVAGGWAVGQLVCAWRAALLWERSAPEPDPDA